MHIAKPKVLQDIRRSEESAFRAKPYRVNLGYRPPVRLPAMRITRSLIVLAAFGALIIGSVTAPTVSTRAAATSSTDQATAERTQLEAQLATLEGQINQYEGQITAYQRQGSSLKGEISTLSNKIAKLNLQISAIHLTLASLDRQISDTQFKISATEGQIASHRDSLGALMQNLYQKDHASLMEIFLAHPRLSDFWSDVANTTLLQENVRAAIEQITMLRSELQDTKTQLALTRADTASVQQYEEAQKAQVNSVTAQKQQLLADTKGQESKYQSLLAVTKATAAQIRSRIFQLLGGGELSFEQAYEYAKLASSATGVDPALILAVLDRESALGQNVGKCGWRMAMSPSNQQVFIQLTQALSIGPDSVTVSCANKDGAYGGAMGPAQFIPSTWQLYSASIATVTGHNPPNPWNNSDAFAATALYLKDLSGGCMQVYSVKISQERCTAAKYYAGSHWRSYLWTYGDAVVTRAQSFSDDISTITG